MVNVGKYTSPMDPMGNVIYLWIIMKYLNMSIMIQYVYIIY